MKDIKMLCEGKYIYIPGKKNPRVILAVHNKDIANNSFKLYKPFSRKARFAKSIFLFLFLNLNSISCLFLQKRKQSDSKFLDYLESKLKEKIVTSVYYATANDKLVLQIQANGKIIGYLKYPLNKRGRRHIKKEHKAIKYLSNKNFSDTIILFDYFEGIPFLLLKELVGESKLIEDLDLNRILNELKHNKKYQLRNHPRILELRKKLAKKGYEEYTTLLDRICYDSKEYYFVVNEHGDFAPWNIISTGGEYFLFDFEFFKKNGLQYMDLIKYYFQVGNLLYHYKERELIALISDKIPISEIILLIKIFLIKEILRKKKEKEVCTFEKNILDGLADAKI